MKLDIVQVGHPVLRQPARPLLPAEIISTEIQTLIASMRETMHAAPGVGLAAPQVGAGFQLAVVEDREEYHKEVDREMLRQRERVPVPFHVLINPRILTPEIPLPSDRDPPYALAPGDRVRRAEFFEGCLSLAGFSAVVPRERRVRVQYLNERAEEQFIEASGWYARILQHEIDHLNGILYVDRMNPRTLTSLENWKQYWKEKPIAEIG